MRMHKFVVTGTLLMASALVATAAHAGGQVQWQIGIETPVIRLPGHVVLPLPPIPVPRVVVSAPVYDQRDFRAPRRWDADGDGIPNRYDRAYTPRWDRDGDGIPNRYDARPDDARNGRGWHAGPGARGNEARRDHRQEDRRDDRRDWRDDHQRR